MSTSEVLRHLLPIGVVTMLTGLSAVNASDPDPRVMSFKLPDQLQWSENHGNGQNALLYGDPRKPGFYMVLHKWPPHTMGRPHSHPNDRFIYVVEGTWWVGSGSKYDPDSTFPMPKGSFVRHLSKQVHYDGAKEGEVILLISGEGPDTAPSGDAK